MYLADPCQNVDDRTLEAVMVAESPAVGKIPIRLGAHEDSFCAE
jgi:hypothetical protein